jgi:UDPglucose 6-dehydrogenase
MEFNMQVGVIGNGFVGNAIYQNFKDKVLTKVFDVKQEKRLNELSDVLGSDIIFICLPTPMKETGECDLSYVDDFFNELDKNPRTLKNDPLFVIKSTVPIGTTEKLRRKYPFRIVHNPEFLTAVNAVEDFKNSDRNIIGGNQELCLVLRDFYNTYFPGTPIQIVSSNESETIKYFCNSFLASKVAFFNNLYEICQKLAMNFDSVKDGVCSDTRIGSSHTKVPGPDGLMGFGGYCFPKDINALINTLKDQGIDDRLFSTVWEYNKSIRQE